MQRWPLVFLFAACTDVPVAPAPDACSPLLDLALAPGEARMLSEQEAGCFRIESASGAEYLVAGLDGSLIARARRGPEGAPAGDVTYRLQHVMPGGALSASLLQPGTNLASAAMDAAATLPLSPEPLRVQTSTPSPADAIYRRAAPWQEGELFTLGRVDDTGLAEARVLRIYAGRIVFAVVESDTREHSPKLLEDTHLAMEFLRRRGFALLQSALGENFPRTSPGSDQLLVVFSSWSHKRIPGIAQTRIDGDTSEGLTSVWINLRFDADYSASRWQFDNPAYRLKVLAHELVHAWQVQYDRVSQSPPYQYSFGPDWSREGVANLLAHDLVLRYLEMPLQSNWEWETALETGSPEQTLTLEPLRALGSFTEGYYHSASFLRDLQVRLIRSGVSDDVALREIARGAQEGWYGFGEEGVRRAGLVARMRARIPGWNPEEALLTWTLSQAADDMHVSEELQNHVFHSVLGSSGGYGWKPLTGMLATGAPFDQSVRHLPGSSFFFRLAHQGPGGVLSFTADHPHARWMILRVRLGGAAAAAPQEQAPSRPSVRHVPSAPAGIPAPRARSKLLKDESPQRAGPCPAGVVRCGTAVAWVAGDAYENTNE